MLKATLVRLMLPEPAVHESWSAEAPLTSMSNEVLAVGTIGLTALTVKVPTVDAAAPGLMTAALAEVITPAMVPDPPKVAEAATVGAAALTIDPVTNRLPVVIEVIPV